MKISGILENIFKAVKISFNHNRHVMIVEDEETRKTQIAK